jgi:molecular chaperone GrpE
MNFKFKERHFMEDVTLNENIENVTETANQSDSTAPDEESELRRQIEDLKNDLALSRADLYNYRQRAEKERSRLRGQIAEDSAAEFFPVLDNLDRALNISEDASTRDVLVGIKMVHKQFLNVLAEQGIEPISAVGTKFDPALHEAVQTDLVEDPDQDGLILDELQRGYRASSRILRPAQVRVAKLQQQPEITES